MSTLCGVSSAASSMCTVTVSDTSYHCDDIIMIGYRIEEGIGIGNSSPPFRKKRDETAKKEKGGLDTAATFKLRPSSQSKKSP